MTGAAWNWEEPSVFLKGCSDSLQRERQRTERERDPAHCLWSRRNTWHIEEAVAEEHRGEAGVGGMRLEKQLGPDPTGYRECTGRPLQCFGKKQVKCSWEHFKKSPW